MKWLKSYKSYSESLKLDFSVSVVNIDESLSINIENILSSIGAEEVDIFDKFSLPKDDYIDKLDIENLSDNIEFINSLSSIGLKKSQIQNSEDYECYANKPCRFMFIYNIEANELENPNYIIIQSWSDSLEKWSNSKLYKVNGDIKKFYDKLSSKTIEIDDDGEKYLYTSSNKNEWELKSGKENDIYKKVFRKDDLEQIIKDNKVKVNII